SIRRIISEDEAPADEGEAASAAAEVPAAVAAEPEPQPTPEPAAAAPEPAPAAAEPEPVAAAAPEPVHEEEALELTDKVETHGDLDVVAPAAAPEPAAATPLVSERAATAAASAFGALSAAIAMPKSDRTLEDVVRELLRPLLQQWLDDNLAGIVQQAVEAEVERIARGRVR
ncbi:MAG: DUF2497 domain-containing protein, partial [Phenylobacterium sp.]